MRYTALAILAACTTAVVADDACPPLHYVYARATTEPPQGIGLNATAKEFEDAARPDCWWSQGFGAAGAALYRNLTTPSAPTYIPGLTGYAVHYPANYDIRNSVNKGAEDMLRHLVEMSKKCPKTKYILGGHSQGSGVTNATIPTIPQDILAKVIAVTIFGGSQCQDSVKDRCKSYCYKDDDVCDPKSKSTRVKGTPPKGATPPPPHVCKPPVPDLTKSFVKTADCSKDVPERDLEVDMSKYNGYIVHTVYTAEGSYIWAAACWIQSQWKKIGTA